MRFSTTSALMALPLLASAAEQVPLEGPLYHIKAEFQKYADLAAPFIPHWNTYDAAHAAAAKAGGSNIDILSLSNWKSTLRNSVSPASSKPEEWWIFVTGGNKTCYGHCHNSESAFNETALLFKADPTAPHMGMVNCDLQPILCNAWATGPPALYIMEVTPGNQPVEVHFPRFNASSITAQDMVKMHTTNSWKETEAYEGYFHPFDGELAKYGLANVVGWVLFAFNVLPNWLFMLLVSFASRSFMGKRMQPGLGGAVPTRAGAAPAGGARR